MQFDHAINRGRYPFSWILAETNAPIDGTIEQAHASSVSGRQEENNRGLMTAIMPHIAHLIKLSASRKLATSDK